MSPELSKALLRERIRSARSDRSLTTPDSASPRLVADAAWSVVTSVLAPPESLGEADLTGCTMLAYSALPGEPNLNSLIDRFLELGGRVFLPVVTKIGHPLSFGEVTGSVATLEPRGKWGIREPDAQVSAAELLLAEVGLDLIFVPALGFGAGGARLGNGGGFYDRTFGPQGEVPLPARDASSPHGRRSTPRVFGVCFADEVDLPGLTVEDWDLQIAHAVTEQGVHTFGLPTAD